MPPSICRHLSFILLSLSLTSSFTRALQCYSTICENPDEHGFCTQTCTRPDQACHGTFFITPNHTVTPGTFQCFTVKDDECQARSCQIDDMSSSFAYCCCRRDHCNIIPGLFGDNTPAPPIINPTPPVTPPPLVPGNQLVCEFNNCTSSSNTDCYHGYQICAEHPSAGTVSSSPLDHFCEVHALRTSTGHYELQSKGCLITTDPVIHQLGEGRGICTLDTLSAANQISCYCNQLYCNNGTNLLFTDASRFIGPTGDILCDGGCSHSCVISGGSPRCLCPVGYALNTDLMTCVDIDECLDPHGHPCSHICINTEGSYKCDCPPDRGLRLASDETTCEPVPGLVCARHDRNCTALNGCNNVSFCDRHFDSLDLIISPEEESCIVVGGFEDGEFVIQLQSCFSSPLHEPCTQEKCILEVPPGSKRDVYSCCCRSNLCNAHINIVYPNGNDTSYVPLPTTTAIATTGEVSMGSTIPESSTDSLSQWTLPVFATVASIFAIVVVVMVIVFILVCRQPCQNKSGNDNSQPIEIGHFSPITTQLLPRATHFENPPIGSGRFSMVYKEVVGRENRAVKVFQRKDKLSYDRELAIYNQPNFKHQNILLFITNNEYPEEIQLIFEYHPMGSLYDVLNKQQISLKQFCEIAISSARGLAHLHTEVIKDGALVKPCVAHRDLKSKNILIKSDMTACISDFGLAIKWPIEVATEAQGQVGTARYMAPEVLEGAISFDREAYFRIDVYAFSLILWELTTRTKTMNGPVTDYHPPFDELVASNPSIDDMKRVVVDRQKRPVIPKTFTNYSEMDDIVYTIQETWDADADARLSAQCVYERLVTFASKFDSLSKDSGFSPTEFDATEPLIYSTPSHSSSLMSGSPTNTMKPAISEASTTLTGGAVPLGYPNAAVPIPNANADRPEVMSSVANNNKVDQHPATAGVGGVGPRPPPGGGNPMVNYPQLPAINVAPPLHSPGEYQYRFVQAPAFPRYPHPPPNNNQHRHGNQSQSPAAMAHSGRPLAPSPSSVSPQRNHIAASEQYAHLNHRNSREIAQHTPISPVQHHLESTV